MPAVRSLWAWSAIILGSLLLIFPFTPSERAGASSPQKWPERIGLLVQGRGEPELTLQNGRNLPEDRPGDGGRSGVSWPTRLSYGDFNGDGWLDLLIAYARTGGGELALRFGNGRGDFTTPLRVPVVGQEPSALLVEDFDQDGALDVAVGYTDEPVVSIYMGTGRGSLQWKEDVRLGLMVSGLASGDFNRDGMPDLLVASSSPPFLALLPADRRGQFGTPWFFSLNVSGAVLSLGEVRVADLDGDGRLDGIVLYRGQRSGVAVLYGAEDGKFSYPQFLSAGVALEGLAIGDFDQDKRTDIVVTDAASGSIFVLRGRENRMFTSPMSFHAGTLPGPLTIANLNNDGYPDLAVVERGSNRITVLLGNASGAFDRSVSYDVDSPPVAVVAGRFRQGALDDLVVAKQGGATVAIALNAPPTIVVTTTADEVRQDGRVSLREAILAANGNPPNPDVPSGRGNAPDVIGFDLPEAQRSGGVFTIRVSAELGPLPRLTDGGTTIDGTTQRGFAGTPIIVLDGSQAGAVDGLTIASSLNVVRGVVVSGFGSHGIRIVGGEAPVTGNVIAGCYIGTDASGQRARGNGLAGIHISGDSVSNTLIGGTAAADRNVISGNGGDGIEVRGLARNTQIVGNYIGVAADGRTPLPNGGAGLLLTGADNVTIGGTASGAGNVISGNSRHGLQVRNSTGVRAQGNLIGVDARGAAVVKNGDDGIFLADVFNAQIGGVSASARNVISGNEGNGVTLVRSTGSKIQGNYIGTDATGRQALGNGGAGIHVDFNSPNNLIGGAVEGAGNVISGNRGSGLFLGAGALGTQVFGNRIGVDATGQVALGNGGDGITANGGGNHQIGSSESVARNIISGNAGDGVKLLNASENRLVGNAIGTDAGGTIALPNGGNGVRILSTDGSASRNTVLQNTIAYNRGAGVRILGSGTGNRLSQNSIFQNEDLGIDRGGQGVIPQITAITEEGGGRVTVRGVFSAPAPAGAVIEVYLADPDPSGRGEGKVFLGSTRANDRGEFSLALSGRSRGEPITCTATDFRGDTSEFADNFIIGEGTLSVRVLQPNGGEILIGGSTFTIRWEAGGGVASQEIALSLDGGATFPISVAAGLAADVREFSWRVPTTVSTVRGRIRVTVVNAQGRRAFDQSDADFIIDSQAPVVRVVSPNGREVFRGGDVFEILWKASDDTRLTRQSIQLSTDGGATYTDIVTLDGDDPQVFRWKVPLTLFTQRGRIRIVAEDIAGKVSQDASDADFSILPTESEPPFIQVLSPNGGEILCAGTPFRITWRVSDNTAVKFQDVLLSTDGGARFNPIVERLPGTAQSFDWSIPARLSTTRAFIAVRVRDFADNVAVDTSDELFSIDGASPTINGLTVGTGSVFVGGERVLVSWTSSDDVQLAAHVLELSTDGGATWTLITNLPGDASQFLWTIPRGVRTGDGRLRVTVRDTCGRTAQAVSGRFSIAW
ncbi:MAG: FG-GAP-like repeat-containing protein [Blastocatellia bacterium]|nr:FG-GAP-like repeat-containing protein [Blastocatellia bacterium]MCS7157354.1 FG-GAP-like repeat-containing protein [Blastocatellia bacterium]MCX7753220.1 FG-GAP-like repeat-containing protein [Blastocatellia bacterium]MDW8168259.1 FG-GAP-like repeat-containing protein [Acidobacteriota bacterium]MDW8255448.1 FG-GAP-like repeat-containing protein [Acidobacteriota bacterium]